MNSYEQAERLKAFSEAMQLDGDLMRCQSCCRRQHISHRDEPFHHVPECSHGKWKNPWNHLTKLLRKGEN